MLTTSPQLDQIAFSVIEGACLPPDMVTVPGYGPIAG
jgi:hypothetical protein